MNANDWSGAGRFQTAAPAFSLLPTVTNSTHPRFSGREIKEIGLIERNI
jgi:hypothetical protein